MTHAWGHVQTKGGLAQSSELCPCPLDHTRTQPRTSTNDPTQRDSSTAGGVAGVNAVEHIRTKLQ